MSMEAVSNLKPTYLDGLITRFKPFSSVEQKQIDADKKAKTDRKRQRELDNWYAMQRWSHLRTLPDLAVYLAPPPIQSRLEKAIAPERIRGYHRSKDPFQLYKD